jgi:hypothetical protein
MNFKDIREGSCKVAKKFDIQVPNSLPFLDIDSLSRSQDEIISRALSVAVMVAVSYGFKKESALRWLEKESLMAGLTEKEKKFLSKADQNREQFHVQVEVLYVFAWALNFLKDLDFLKRCPNYLVSFYPDFKKLEVATHFKNRAKLRPIEELVRACDTAYCLHWGLTQARLEGSSKLTDHLSLVEVVERRRASEWILNQEDWDDVKLDT